MEKLRSSRPWRRPINGSSILAGSDYNTASFSVQLDDYSEIFDAAASASSIPVLDLSVTESGFEMVGDAGAGGCRAGVDYSDIFGSFGGGGFAVSYEELFAEPKSSGVSSSENRTRWDLLSEQQKKKASEHPLKVYTENNEPILEKNHHSSFPKQSNDNGSKNFSMAYHTISREKFDDVVSDKDASDPVHESKNKTVNRQTVVNTGTKASAYFPSTSKNFSVNPMESNSASLLDVPADEKHNSQSYSYHSTSSGYVPLHDVAYLKVSEISLQTNPFKGAPPSRPPPKLSMKPEHPKALSADSRFETEERSSLKSEANDQLNFTSEATNIHKIDESMKGIAFSPDAEVDPSSAAAVSIAAIKEAMEQAQARLTRAKKLMDRKREKSHWKVGPLRTMGSKEDGTAGNDVELKSRSKVIDANNLLKDSNTISESTAVEREEIRSAGKIPLSHGEIKMQLFSYRKDQQQVRKENASKSFVEREELKTVEKIPLNHEERKMQLPSYKKDQQLVRKENASKSSELECEIVEIAGEWKTDKDYYKLPRNGSLLNTVNDVSIQEDEKTAKSAICSDEDKEKYNKDSEQAIEVEEKQKSMEVSVCIEKLEKDNMLKVFSMDCMDEAYKNLADATMDSFLLKDHASELEKDIGSLQSAENLKQSEAHKDNNIENDANKTGFVVDYCLYKDNVNKLVNEVNDEVKVQNETLFHDIFEKEIKELDELCTFDETDKNKVDVERKPGNNYENETRSMKYQYSYNAYKCEVEDSNNAAEKDEGDKFQINEEARILVENKLEREAIQDENRLKNGLEMPEAQEKMKDEELEQVLNSTEGTYCKDCNEKETRDVPSVLQQNKELMGDLMNQDVKNYEFLASADDACGERVSENITEVEESDTRKVFLSRKEVSLLATALDATEVSHVDKAGNHKCTEVEENNSKMNVGREREKEPETNLEEKNLDIERERERIAVERANYEAHQQVLAEARVKAEKIAVERATAEARQRALAEALQKAEKTAEAEKASREARLRAERAAVERATEEARKRAIEKALAVKASADSRERTAQFSASNKDRLRKDNRREYFRASHIKEDSDAKYKPNLDKIQRNAQSQTASSSTNNHIYSDSHNNGNGAESKLSSKARQERQQQTAERASKALAERNMRDILAQREQAERDRLAESLDGEVRRWSSGKDGNLRALLSTLQYILGPDSGWLPIPPTDIMNASAAKKAYRKATLCVHPDKLQQRGATIQQKYICEKVFDLLQEAWNKFNSEER
ncbi:auxilin-like protein 1 isoform X2 [Dendrobium catenatum]|uniref:auxilin-like protein 1 isoform X2 n=1 Tax=Dendrobium catenatum TaxID=906689 RepID=UPI0009F30D65|nr:auxilin-like protein 1 isoform X2 [Dendrobium catenatum]